MNGRRLSAAQCGTYARIHDSGLRAVVLMTVSMGYSLWLLPQQTDTRLLLRRRVFGDPSAYVFALVIQWLRPITTNWLITNWRMGYLNRL